MNLSIQETKNIGYFAFALLGAVGLPHEGYIILALLMVVDTLFGVIRVGVVHGGHHIRSYRLSSGILAKMCVLLVPLIIAWAGRGAGISLTFLATSAISVLTLAQLYSIIGNVYSIWTRQDQKEFDAVSFILKRIQIGIEKLIKENAEAHTNADMVALKKKRSEKITSNEEQ